MHSPGPQRSCLLLFLFLLSSAGNTVSLIDGASPFVTPTFSVLSNPSTLRSEPDLSNLQSLNSSSSIPYNVTTSSENSAAFHTSTYHPDITSSSYGTGMSCSSSGSCFVAPPTQSNISLTAMQDIHPICCSPSSSSSIASLRSNHQGRWNRCFPPERFVNYEPMEASYPPIENNFPSTSANSSTSQLSSSDQRIDMSLSVIFRRLVEMGFNGVLVHSLVKRAFQEGKPYWKESVFINYVLELMELLQNT